MSNDLFNIAKNELNDYLISHKSEVRCEEFVGDNANCKFKCSCGKEFYARPLLVKEYLKCPKCLLEAKEKDAEYDNSFFLLKSKIDKIQESLMLVWRDNHSSIILFCSKCNVMYKTTSIANYRRGKTKCRYCRLEDEKLSRRKNVEKEFHKLNKDRLEIRQEEKRKDVFIIRCLKCGQQWTCKYNHIVVTNNKNKSMHCACERNSLAKNQITKQKPNRQYEQRQQQYSEKFTNAKKNYKPQVSGTVVTHDDIQNRINENFKHIELLQYINCKTPCLVRCCDNTYHEEPYEWWSSSPRRIIESKVGVLYKNQLIQFNSTINSKNANEKEIYQQLIESLDIKKDKQKIERMAKKQQYREKIFL